MWMIILGLLILFILGDILMRFLVKQHREKKIKEERAKILAESIKIDFTSEAKSLKRAEVKNPKARILAVDDEEVILGSFRKILVLDGYSVDTVESGKEALGLIQKHHYDFVFTDLKMPEMDGVDVAKGVKHLRPDIDVIIITGYATVETAVECMKYGAMDYMQKPFTEDELLENVNKFVVKRNSNIEKLLKPRVQITHLTANESSMPDEYFLPGGVFISDWHTWMAIEESGEVKVGIDDFANKLIGDIEGIEVPNLGMDVKKGQVLFSLRVGKTVINFKSPITGKVKKVNQNLVDDPSLLKVTPYEKHFICIIDSEKLDEEIRELMIGNTAVNFIQDEIERYQLAMQRIVKFLDAGSFDEKEKNFIGALSKIDFFHREELAEKFFVK